MLISNSIVRRVWAFLLLIGWPTVSAFGQQDSKNLGDASLEELGNIQVYSASKHLQRTGEAPSSVTVVTRDEIQKFGYRTLADVLRSVRGFYVTYDRNYSYIGVRGFGRLGDWNNRILVLIDGHRINNNIFDQAMVGVEFPVDVDLIERVEIVRGPGSSLYGSNAFFAVINVVTRKPSQMKGVELSFAPGSFETFQGRATYGGSFKGLDMLLSNTALNSQGQNQFYPEFNTPANNNGVAVNLDGVNSLQTLAEFSFRGFTAQVVYNRRDKLLPTAPFGDVFNDPRTRAIVDQAYIDLSYEHALADGWRLFARTSIDEARLAAPSPVPGTGGVTNLNNYAANGDWWTGDLRLTRTFMEKHSITVGSEVRDNFREQQAFFLPQSNTLVSTKPTSTIAAFYAQDEFVITPKLLLNAGLRYDHYYGITGTTNPRLALIYHPWSQTSLKMLYGTAFRAPDALETYPVAGVSFENNPSLVPETIRSVEGVVEQELGQHFMLSGSVFQNRIKDLITIEFDPNAFLLVNRNAGKAVATGTEFEFTARNSDGWQATTSFTYVDASDGSAQDLQLSNSPRHMAKLNLIAPLLRNRLFAGLDAQYTGQRHTLAGNTLGGFPLFNLTLLGHTLGSHLDLSAGLYNLLDKKYSDPGRPETVQDAIPQDGRSFRIKITGRF